MKSLFVLLTCIVLGTTAHAQGSARIQDQEKIDASLEEIKSMPRESVDRLASAISICFADPYSTNAQRDQSCSEATKSFLISSPPGSPTASLLSGWNSYLAMRKAMGQSLEKTPPPADEVNPAAQLAAKWRVAISDRYRPKADTLSDDALKQYAASRYDKAKMMGKREVIGTHRGGAVIADFPCADLCPDSTRRIIHYDLGPGDACKAIGGVEELRTLPGVATSTKLFCVPAALADKDRGRSPLLDAVKDLLQ
jgi:hypothetical protein